jgi:hypothetical protein
MGSAMKHTGTKEASMAAGKQSNLPKSATRRTAGQPYTLPKTSKRVGKV